MEIKDEIVKNVISDLIRRSDVGIKKYGTTLSYNNKDNYYKHAYEEMLDHILYLNKIMTQHNNITEMITKYPNDMELGNKIRELYG